MVFASPHSGRDYAWSFLRKTALDQHQVRSSEDAFVDELFEAAPRLGAPLLKAGAPRAYVDLNRSADELDPALIEGVGKLRHNPRVVANGRAIYRGKLPRAEAERRIEAYWRPYHEALSGQLDQAHLMFGQSVLIDCHSMPHEAMDSVVRMGAKRPEVVLGDRFGAAASDEVVSRIEAAFQAAGLVVVRNTPFAGAYITQRYGRPSRNRHAVQVEIDRALYMNEQLIRPNGNFENFKRLIEGVIADLTDIGRPKAAPLAAE